LVKINALAEPSEDDGSKVKILLKGFTISDEVFNIINVRWIEKNCFTGSAFANFAVRIGEMCDA
jgi:hypothetical protein